MSLQSRIVGRIRRYSEQTKSYQKWEDIVYTPTTTTTNCDDGTKKGDQRIVISLHRGGRLTLYPNILPIGKQRVELQRAMRTCKLYRQYTRSQVYYEPRFHVLLSQSAEVVDVSSLSTETAGAESLTTARGYSYHGVTMKAQPISQVPAISTYATELASMYNLPNQTWDIGVDCIIYRDGHDSIGWHADDSQGESIILCVVIAHSPSCCSSSNSNNRSNSSCSGDSSNNITPRSVHIRLKKNNKCNNNNKHLKEGDEEIQLYIHEGDGYDMDGYMQSNYEHCVPKKCIDTSYRFVLIFRHGNVARFPIDSGVALTELASVREGAEILEERIVDEEDNLSFKENKGNDVCVDGNDNHDEDVTSLFSRLRVKRPLVSFGHPPILNSITEGSLYTRRTLYSTYAHRADQRGVNGNMIHGCDSIVVSRQSLKHREEDGLCWLRYTSNRIQGGGALLVSHARHLPIRVFRSSKIITTTGYSPPEFAGGKTSYRYDGLYVVTRVWDQTGQLVIMTGRGGGGGEEEEDEVKKFPGDGIQYTFYLERLLSKSSFPTTLVVDVGYTNELSLNELWTNIQISNERTTTTLHQPFVPPIPTYLETLPELVSDVPRQDDVDDPAVNVPTSRLSLISSQWRVCNSSGEVLIRHQCFDDTCLTSLTTWPNKSNNVLLQQSLVSSRWRSGRSYHDQFSSACRPLNHTNNRLHAVHNQQQMKSCGKTIRKDNVKSLTNHTTSGEQTEWNRFDTLSTTGEFVVDSLCDNPLKLLLRRNQSKQVR